RTRARLAPREPRLSLPQPLRRPLICAIVSESERGAETGQTVSDWQATERAQVHHGFAYALFIARPLFV
ncbi:hypothetical protein, partial [Thermogemmatispora sp.]|uniref:hypothetical protein n=1 Tax=Thermogemmatispora sp. TaxID=1968838 RepID=UPI00257B45B8